jgi:hypothetical protein
LTSPGHGDAFNRFHFSKKVRLDRTNKVCFAPSNKISTLKIPVHPKKAVKLYADHQSEDKINSTSSVVAVQVDIDVDDKTLTMRRQSPAPGYYGTKNGREVFKRFWILDHVSLFPPCHSVPTFDIFSRLSYPEVLHLLRQ